MDIIKTVREIGLFEAARNLSMAADSLDVRNKIEESMPMPQGDFAAWISATVDHLLKYGKHKILLLSPEIALLEEFAARKVSGIRVILAIPCDMDPESKARLRNNIPTGILVQILDEPYFPETFTPANGMIVSFGYMASDRLMVLPECYRMTEHYGGFWGEKVYVPFVIRKDSVRFGNWMEINPSKFTDVWKGE